MAFNAFSVFLEKFRYMGFLYLCNKDFEHNSFLVAVSIQKQLLVYNKDRQRKASYSVYELV